MLPSDRTPGRARPGGDVGHGQRRVRLPAWAGSAILHAVVFLSLALAWRPVLRSAGSAAGEPDRAGQIALVQMRRGSPEYLFDDAGSTSASTNSFTPVAPPDSPLPGLAAAEPSADERLPDPNELAASGSSAVHGIPDAVGLAATGGPRGDVGGKATTGVFGVEGTGTKFVYVFDRSASMGDLEGRPLRAAQQQLLASLRQLGKTHQFQIVFYNEAPTVFNPNAPLPPRLLFADEQMQQLAERYVGGIVAAGGTEHWEALKVALDMRPDVVFLLTDGTEHPITPGQLDQIRRRNRRQGTQINAIEFGSGPRRSSYNFLQRLAEQNHGNYVYVDVTQLGR